MRLLEEVLQLKRDTNATILAHNYQIPEIQDAADFMGDSLGLAKAAQKVDSERIVFCGVDFMAETAKILNPEKTVLMPEPDAKCPMAAQLNAKQVAEFKAKYNIPAVLYVNTSAEAKAEADYLCTSGNAVEIVNKISSDKILFGPDKNMAYWIQKQTGKQVICVPEDGYCITHRHCIDTMHIEEARKTYPGAAIIVHPECNPPVQDSADYIASTGGMVRLCKQLDAKNIGIGTKEGLVYRLQKENPEKNIFPLNTGAICHNMKKVTMEKLRDSLKFGQYSVLVQGDLADKVRPKLEAMIK